MEAAVPVGQSPWDVSGVFVVSHDFAKQPDIVAGLSTVAWDLVAVDEAHRFAAGGGGIPKTGGVRRSRSALVAPDSHTILPA